ncbi:MAG: Rrf2 family transcriptional regulator [Clostridiales bacterium GWB2_37_7]|nr:MAG: Rrf2 family transcriptional regulator [Clostridiales bacterium GWB2_37_7]
MKISTKGRYGLKAMMDLTLNSFGEPLNLKSIAERQNVSEKYLEHIFSALKKSGLIKSIKGTQGGYILAQSASETTIGNVIRALEGDLSVAEKASGEEGDADILDQCINSNVYEKIDNSINQLLDSMTLEDLQMEYKKMNMNKEYMFYI